MSEDSINTPRRASRLRNKPKKYGDNLELAQTKRRHEEEVESSEEDDYEEHCPQKPTGNS